MSLKSLSKHKIILAFIVELVIIIVVVTILQKQKISTIPIKDTKNKVPMSYHANIINLTQENSNYRSVLFTGHNSQLVIMSIPPGGEVGEETHKYTEQTLFFLSGTGEGMLDDKKFSIVPGDVVVVVPGTKHNFWNTGKQDLQIYTVYTPPNHLPGLIEATKSEADSNTADEAVGNTPPVK